MKTLSQMEIGDELDEQIGLGMKFSDLCKADVVRQALKIGLPQFAARFQPAPLWLEERIREALAEPAEATTMPQFNRTMKAIADGRRTRRSSAPLASRAPLPGSHRHA
jgi:hypothetical protein